MEQQETPTESLTPVVDDDAAAAERQVSLADSSTQKLPKLYVMPISRGLNIVHVSPENSPKWVTALANIGSLEPQHRQRDKQSLRSSLKKGSKGNPELSRVYKLPPLGGGIFHDTAQLLDEEPSDDDVADKLEPLDQEPSHGDVADKLKPLDQETLHNDIADNLQPRIERKEVRFYPLNLVMEVPRWDKAGSDHVRNLQTIAERKQAIKAEKEAAGWTQITEQYEDAEGNEVDGSFVVKRTRKRWVQK